eukprot:6203873-Pleurochrysis_carterae.AAC.2
MAVSSKHLLARTGHTKSNWAASLQRAAAHAVHTPARVCTYTRVVFCGAVFGLHYGRSATGDTEELQDVRMTQLNLEGFTLELARAAPADARAHAHIR